MGIQREETEKEIINAAKNVFTKKGFKCSTMRDIASEANVNLAMLNYYFRSKENLFEIIFEEAFISLASNIIPVFSSNKNIFDKIYDFTELYIEGLIQNPIIPGFVSHEIFINPDRFTKILNDKKAIKGYVEAFEKQIEKEIQLGNIKSIEPMDLLINAIALCVFPFIARPIAEDLLQPKERYNDMLKARKKTVAQFIIDAIKK